MLVRRNEYKEKSLYRRNLIRLQWLKCAPRRTFDSGNGNHSACMRRISVPHGRLRAVGTNNMAFFSFLWTDEIVEHVAEHGLSQDDFEDVVNRPVRRGISRSSGLPAAWGYTEDGRYIMAVYEEIDDITILPVTAYEVPEPR